MATYARLYLDYTQTYSDFERRRVWSIWYHADTAWILVLSATLSAIGFVYFSIHMVLLMHAEAPDALPWGLYVYGLFLLFSAMYAPLLAYERVGWVNAWAIVGCLVAVACNAVALSVWTQQQWKWSEAPFLNLSVAWLAAHCTLLDLGVWGYAWSNGWIWPASSAGGIMHEEDGESVGEAEQYPCLVIRYV
jgi:hypothetical protein